jgi:predicted secreted protein with PEFG-CTERM motif
MEYKAYALMAILLAAVATVGTLGNAYALTVETDNTSYSTGDTITVSGNVEVTPTGEPLVIQVFNPNGAAYRFDQVDVAADGSYTYELAVGGPLGVSGEYRVVTTYAGEQEETTFDFTGTEGPRTITLTVGDSEFEIEYDISGGSLTSLTGEEETATVTAMINASSDGEVTFWFPREVFNSLNDDGTDLEFIVFVDEIEEFPDDDMGTDVRQVTIPFSAGSEQIDIVGTFLAPEFGTIAAVVLAVAIVGIIVATTRYSKFSFLPKM